MSSTGIQLVGAILILEQFSNNLMNINYLDPWNKWWNSKTVGAKSDWWKKNKHICLFRAFRHHVNWKQQFPSAVNRKNKCWQHKLKTDKRNIYLSQCSQVNIPHYAKLCFGHLSPCLLARDKWDLFYINPQTLENNTHLNKNNLLPFQLTSLFKTKLYLKFVM